MMLAQTEGQMYLSGTRGVTLTKKHRSFHTFNDEGYYDNTRQPFGNLTTCNDDTLVGEERIKVKVMSSSKILILPLVGAIEVKDSAGKLWLVDIGQAMFLHLSATESYEVINPDKKELVNFLQLRFEQNAMSGLSESKHICFDLDANRNRLQAIDKNCFIGKFSGREEGFFMGDEQSKGIFGYVIEGAFEFQNRLLEIRDSVALWNTNSTPLNIEFEALSNDAILLIVKVEIKGEISF